MAEKRYYADSQAFFDLPGNPLVADPDIRLDLGLVTVAPPVGREGKDLDIEVLLGLIKKGTSEINSQKDLRIILSAGDIAEAEKAEQTAVVLGLQNSPERLGILNEDINDTIGRMFGAGVRVFGLWYQGRNELGGGFACPLEPLTELGQKVISQLSELGAILDLSHAGFTTARQVLAFIEKEKLPIKVMISHTGCYSVFPHIRNLPDDVLKQVAERDGYIGIATLVFILSQIDNDSSDSFLEHLEYTLDICGDDAVGIGSDGTYRTVDLEKLERKFEEMESQLDPYGIMQPCFPDHPRSLFSPKKMEILEEELLISSFEEDLLDGFIGGNLRSFFLRSLPQ